MLAGLNNVLYVGIDTGLINMSIGIFAGLDADLDIGLCIGTDVGLVLAHWSWNGFLKNIF